MTERTAMDDNEYARSRADLLAARETVERLEDDVLDAAWARGEAYVLHANYYGWIAEWPFLSLAEAVGRAGDDCSPEFIAGPGGQRFTPDGEPIDS